MRNVLLVIGALIAIFAAEAARADSNLAVGRSVVYCVYALRVSDAVAQLNQDLQQDLLSVNGILVAAPFEVSSPSTYHTNDNNVNDYACVTLTKR